MENTKTIPELVREMEQLDQNGQTTSSKYVTFSLREDVNKTEAYINSKHTSGDVDYMQREKPFFNIVLSAVNIWFRATDIDRKNITIRATKESDEIEAFLATILLQEWMKKSGFGKFLNDWGLSLARHGSSVVKFIEKNGELNCQVVDWNTLLCDAVDFDNNMKVEKLWFTPAQLRKNKSYDKDLVEKLIDSSTTNRKTLSGQTVDNKSGYIPVYEVHGELPLSLLTDNEDDEDTYVQQMHVITFLATKDNGEKFEEYTLYSGREGRDPYQITHLLKKDGQTYAGGAVKNLFEAQWMVNHSQKQMKDQLDLASKIIFQTADKSFVGQNALTNIENGDILTHEANGGLTRLASNPDIAAMQSFKNDWQTVANQINGISEAMMGENPPSGTAWRQTNQLLQESHSLFELMTENKGLDLEVMLRTYVIPYFKKQLNHADAISSILEDYQIKQIDARYVPNEVNRRVNQKKKQTILSGAIYDPGTEATDTASAQADVQGQLKGNQRFVKPSEIDGTTWKEVCKDLEWELDVDITGEGKDTKGIMDTLTTMLQTIASNPNILQDPNMKLIFNRILSLSGAVSPLELQQATPPQPPPQPMQQQPAQQPAMAAAQ